MTFHRVPRPPVRHDRGLSVCRALPPRHPRRASRTRDHELGSSMLGPSASLLLPATARYPRFDLRWRRFDSRPALRDRIARTVAACGHGLDRASADAAAAAGRSRRPFASAGRSSVHSRRITGEPRQRDAPSMIRRVRETELRGLRGRFEDERLGLEPEIAPSTSDDAPLARGTIHTVMRFRHGSIFAGRDRRDHRG